MAHAHKYQNRRKKSIPTNYSPLNDIHQNWVNGFNSGQELGYQWGMFNGWAMGMATAGMIACGVVITMDLIEQYNKQKRMNMQMDHILDSVEEKKGEL